MNPTKKALSVAAAGTVLGLGGLAVIAVPAGAGEAPPELPAISAEKLVASALRADVPAFQGKVEVANNLGLPPLPTQGGMPPLEFDSATVYSDGDGDGRIAVHDGADEFTAVRDGNTVWTYDSAENTATKAALPETGHDAESMPAPATTMANPAKAASALLAKASKTSEIAVDGTATVADRPAYQLMLTPKPAEKTLLREIRVTIDSQTRMPLGMSVMVNGTTEPALRVGFTEIEFGPQPDNLFSFTPPEGAEVVTHEPSRAEGERAAEHARKMAGDSFRTVGEGWDTVLVGDLGQNLRELADSARNAPEGMNPRQLLERFGEKVSGPFGTGYLIGFNGGNALITDDGRVAAGAVPQQVLVQALGTK